MDVAEADRKLSEVRYAHALRERAENRAPFPDLAPEVLTAAYPGRSQSLTQVLSTADSRMNGLTQR